MAAMFGLGVAVLLGVFWSPGDHWPFATPTTTSTTTATVYPVDFASKVVTTGCGAVGDLTWESMRDESRRLPVTLAASVTYKQVEGLEQTRVVLTQYSPIVSAAFGVSTTLQSNAGSHRWEPVITALEALADQCQRLGLQTGAGSPINP
jgi:hypothetical protein